MEQDGLLLPEVKTALEDIIGQCFINNRYADRIVSILSVSYIMPNASNIIHKKIAHAYLNEHGADGIGDYMNSRNATIVYNATLLGNQEYGNAIECFDTLLKNQLDLEHLVQKAIDIAYKKNDLTTKVFLDNFLRDLIPYTTAMLTLVDKANQYNISDLKECATFDHHIGTFGLDALKDY